MKKLDALQYLDLGWSGESRGASLRACYEVRPNKKKDPTINLPVFLVEGGADGG